VTFLVVGLSHRGVPLDLLERMTVPAARLPKALDDLARRPFVREAVILSTCHRTEVYAVTEGFHGGVQSIRDFLGDLAFVAPEDFSDHLVTYHDESAVAHLLAVAAGVESVVRGESQILGQVRQAWDRARDHGACGGRLDAVFRQAMETGRRVRSETGIGKGISSLSDAAVAMAAARLGPLAGRRIVVLGAGEMGQGVVAGVADRGGGPEVVVASRSRARAQLVAERSGAGTVDLHDLDLALEDADLLVTSTGAPSVVVTTARMADVVQRRQGRPLLIVDMGMPRDVDRGVGGLAGVTLLDLADLRAYVDAGADQRHEVERARAIVADETARFLATAVQRRAAPTVSALRARAEELRRAELARYRSRLSGLDARQQEAVAALTRGILAKLLHEPTVQLKEAAGSPRGERLADAARELFALEDPAGARIRRDSPPVAKAG
jgi:glutamyl-tRNA reductase